MDPWSVVAGGVISSIGSFLGSDTAEMPAYKPNPTWLAMQEDIMRQVQTGLAQGGYTWNDVTNSNMKRLALEAAAKPYAGAQERVMAGLAPYGNVGALGRSLVGLNTARAIDEATAQRNIDIAREQAKQTSYQNLLNTGRSIQDPNLPQQNVDMFNAQLPTTTARLGGAISTGYGTAMNLNQAEQNNNFWKNYLANINPNTGTSMGTPLNLAQPNGLYKLNTNLGIFNRG